MTGEKVDFEAAKAEASAQDAAARSNERSTIAFPYYDLDAAEEVARAVYERSGLSPCPLDELAAEMKVTMSGNFRLKNSAAKVFGFVEKEGASALKLSELGNRLVNKETEAEARATAFLTVPLFSAIFDRYRGNLLPPTKALEREMVSCGVAPKQADKARQVFHRSARQAGFFDSGEDRLVRPRTASAPTADQGGSASPNFQERPLHDELPSKRPEYVTGGGGGDGRSLHPFVEGLLQTMPEPGTVWTIEGRAAWLEAAANIFKLIYKGNGNIIVKADPPETQAASEEPSLAAE